MPVESAWSASVDGAPRRDVVTLALLALKAVWHRGAVDADGKTGDGAGIMVCAPQEFLREVVRRTGHTPRDSAIFVGQIFLPRLDLGAQERARVIVESEIIRAGFTIYAWRQVPVNISQIGEKANATRPEIEQVLFYDPRARDNETVDRDLFVCRRRIEKRALAANIVELYVCSLSARTLVYKGMFLAAQIDAFYPDLRDERFISSVAPLSPALLHQHLPAMALGAAVPHARPQWRDQHAEGQRQLDAQPRDSDGVRYIRRRGRGREAGGAARRLGLGGARQRA